MKNGIRILIYSVIFAVVLCAGIYGLLINYQNNKITNEENLLLTNITNNFNNNERVLTLKENNNIIEMSANNRKLTFKNITNVYTNKYYAEYKDEYIYYEFDKSNSIQNIIFKTLVSSVAEMYGKTYTEVMAILDSTDLTTFIIENGLSYVEDGNNVECIINTKIPINYYSN